MKFGKKIVLINSLIIAFLTAVIVIAAAVAGSTVLRTNIHDTLIGTVSERAAIIEEGHGVVPDDFDYLVGGVYLSVYLSDGTLKHGSFPGEPIERPIDPTGAVATVTVNGAEYYVYDFAVSIAGRNDIYLRGVIAASNDILSVAVISVTVSACILAVLGIALDILSVKRAIRPIDRMRREVNGIAASKDITKRLSPVTSDEELGQLAEAYNALLDGLEGMIRNHERFTSDVAHELRTPLTVILEESDYALRDTEKLEDKNESLETIRRQARRLKAITDSLLEFTRFANRFSIELAPVDLSALTEEFLGDYAFSKGISCHTDIEKGVIVAAEATLFDRVLQNLVDNAVKYGKNGGKVDVSLKKDGTHAVLKVADDGIGMSKEALAHAFDRFYREEPSRTGRAGLGLGLSLVKEIVRLFGAEIAIDSVQGEGTCVTVKFATENLPLEGKVSRIDG